MSFKSVLISFFRQNKVDYYIDKEGICFPCPCCSKTILINSKNTEWACGECQIDGNLKTLVEVIKEEGGSNNFRIYNPKKEKSEIKLLFERLVNKGKAEKKELESLSNKVNELIDYFT